MWKDGVNVLIRYNLFGQYNNYRLYEAGVDLKKHYRDSKRNGVKDNYLGVKHYQKSHNTFSTTPRSFDNVLLTWNMSLKQFSRTPLSSGNFLFNWSWPTMEESEMCNFLFHTTIFYVFVKNTLSSSMVSYACGGGDVYCFEFILESTTAIEFQVFLCFFAV
ncbi:unnamed protein product [Clavelina lepadiformis]|uniref:Uncharacterized protein n=1 Tax=Clavelina lepadiformis TaxID=159417 RepID=A0ABP0GTV1_CLALP